MKKTRYGFQKHLSAEFPSQIIVDSTQFCNLACIHCPHPKFKTSSAYSGAHLSLDLHEKLVSEVATDGHGICQYLRYTANGETLLHPKFSRMIKYAGKYSKTKINVTTNGVLLTEKRIKMLLDANVNVFDISLDAYSDDIYAKIRVKGDLGKVRPNVLKLIALTKEGNYNARTVVSFVEQPLNTHETEEFKKYWYDAGADFVVVRKLHSAAGSKQNISKKLKQNYKSILRKPCLYPWERLVLTPEGDLGFCPAGWTGESHFANFRDTTIKEAWMGDFMTKLREAHMENKYDDFDFCGQCPDWAHTSWPGEGNSYSTMMTKIIPGDLL